MIWETRFWDVDRTTLNSSQFLDSLANSLVYQLVVIVYFKVIHVPIDQCEIVSLIGNLFTVRFQPLGTKYIGDRVSLI